MDKRTIVLCLFLILLLVVLLNRWEVIEISSLYYALDSPSQVVVQIDMLTSLLSIQGFVEGESVTSHQNPYLVHGITAFLYLSMGAAIIALLKETKKKRPEGEE